MKPSKKTGVVIHGHHLGAGLWFEIVWGNPAEGIYGRAAAGIREALFCDASVIIVGTGGSLRDGLKEGEYTYKIMKEHIHELPEMKDIENPLAWLEERVVVETTSTTTETELAVNARVAFEKGCERLVLVTSPVHAMRAHKTALSLMERNSHMQHFRHSLSVVASDVNYEGSTIDDVVTFEPPHRPDRPAVHFNTTLADIALFFNRDDLAPELNEALKKVISEYKQKL